MSKFLFIATNPADYNQLLHLGRWDPNIEVLLYLPRMIGESSLEGKEFASKVLKGSLERVIRTSLYRNSPDEYEIYSPAAFAFKAMAFLYDQLSICGAKIIAMNSYNCVIKQCIYRIAKKLGIELRIMENGVIPDSVFVDPLGLNRDSYLVKSYREHEIEEEKVEFILRRPFKQVRNLSDDALPDLSKEYVFVPLQMSYDTQIVSYAKESQAEFIQSVCSLGIPLIVKPHPYEPDIFVYQKENIRITKVNDTETLVKNAAVVLTQNSSVGFYAWCQKRPVITALPSLYQDLVEFPVPDDILSVRHKSDDDSLRFLSALYDQCTFVEEAREELIRRLFYA
jgi:hypothetical protein